MQMAYNVIPAQGKYNLIVCQILTASFFGGIRDSANGVSPSICSLRRDDNTMSSSPAKGKKRDIIMRFASSKNKHFHSFSEYDASFN